MKESDKYERPFVVLGHSPRIREIHLPFLKDKTVIAVNQAPKEPTTFPSIDHWIVWDDHPNTHIEIRDCFRLLRGDDAVKIWMRSSERSREFILRDHPIFMKRINWFEDAGKHTGFRINDSDADGFIALKLYANICEAACHLAWTLGADVIYLVGVDFIGKERSDGSRFYGGAPETVKTINASLSTLSSKLKIYKTVMESPLQVPFYSGKVYKREIF